MDNPPLMEKGNIHMFTISNILQDIQRGCALYNMNESCFSYRIVYFVNERDTNSKYYIDASYRELRKTLENIIRSNLTLTNCVAIAQITVRKNGKCVCLLSRSYMFSLNDYFRKLNGECRDSYGNTIQRKNVSII